MARINPLMLAPPLIFVGLAALFWFGMARDDPDQLPTALAGRPAPEVSLTALGTAAPFDDATLRDGQVKLVNFWASWCAPCRVEHPNLEEMAENGIAIYGVNYKDEPANALKFLDELGDPYRAMGADPQGRMALNWGLYGVPETYVIAGDGTVVLRHAGPITRRIMADTILPAIEAAAAR